ncbi:Ribosome biogenesis protein bms1 [Drechslerella dactyloides]|uniref:Ribosome biogenesis protein bms1 n=1 Tax=Drechslerella dactyloides TaxID=74499 RepID=A0AAD6NFZ5_DREDA|nr:Ribosome biogenesis protein bms1 [Drechslerella dactyloides]
MALSALRDSFNDTFAGSTRRHSHADTMDQANTPHRPSKTKGKKKSKHTGGPNPKAFAFANPGKLAKQARRSHDVKEKKLHVPLVDRLPEEAPPLVVAVVGPPGTGKTTLIKSLVRRYTKHTLSSIAGPITVVTSKKRRLTFLECDPSLPAMIDTAKIADIVLLLIDGNFGFEMETMEFLNIMSCHGMPSNIFGILTHLDLFKSPATLKAAKKRLKHRFWSELYHGAKLFYLSGVMNGRYPDREILNLSRFISVMKNPRPIIWRNTHPYMLADRMVDLTDPAQIEEDEHLDRTVALYGYLRGTNFPAVDGRVHIPGVGDLSVVSVEGLADPCPTPQALQRMEGKEGSKRRRLGDKQKLLFAPMSDVGGVLVDKDAVYIDVRTNNFNAPGENGEENPVERDVGERLVVSLQGRQNLLGQGNNIDEDGGVRLFSNGRLIRNDDDINEGGRKTRRTGRALTNGDHDDEGFGSGEDEDEDEDDDGFDDGDDDDLEDDDDSGAEDLSADNGAKLQKRFSALNNSEGEANGDDIAFADSDSDLGTVSDVSEQSFDDDELPSDDDDPGEGSGSDIEDEDGNARWKENLTDRALEMFKSSSKNRKKNIKELGRLLYDDSVSLSNVTKLWRGETIDEEEDEDEGDEDDFFKKAKNVEEDKLETLDRGMPSYDIDALERKWKETEADMEDLRRRFITANLLDEQERGDNGNDDEMDDDDFSGFGSDEGDGEFEDLETGEKSGPAEDAEEPTKELTLEQEREKNARKKEELKLRFEEEADEGQLGQEDKEEFGEDEWYEAQKAKLNKQQEVNKAELEDLDLNTRVRIEGFRPGTYAKIVLSNVPCEFVKFFDPKQPILVGGLTPTEDRFGFLQVRIKRHRWHKRILKTNDPLIFSLGWRRFQSTPIYSLSDSRTRNRMLKYTPEHMHCTGTFYGPLIAPNTGFCCVNSISNSTPGFRISATGVVLNVDEGTEIVKKLKLTGFPYKVFKNTAFIKGMFSSALEVAKFEGAGIRTVSGIRGQIKRALSKPDGYFRATFEDKILMSDIVFLRAWYPVKPRKFYNPMTNLLGEDGWQSMRLTGQVRAEEGIQTPLLKDSKYKKIERQTRHFNPLRVPKAVQAGLPFKSQIHAMKPQKKPTYMQKRTVVLGGEEKKARDLLQKLQTMRNEKVEKRREKKEEKRKVYRAKVAENIEMKEAREKREGKEFWKKEGRKRKGDDDGGQVSKSKRRRQRGDDD